MKGLLKGLRYFSHMFGEFFFSIHFPQIPLQSEKIFKTIINGDMLLLFILFVLFLEII